jgi:hypothetical protein
MNNKTSLSLLSALVALAALVLIPLSVELTASVVFATGLVALLLGEYGREIKPLPVAVPVLPERAALPLAA